MYTNVSDVKAYLGITGSTDDVLIEALIEAAQRWIDAYCARTFEAVEGTRYFTVGKDTDGATLHLDRDLCAITSIVTNADATDGGTTLATTEYRTVPRNDTPYYAIRLTSSGGKAWEYTYEAEDGIEVTGKWGWSVAAPENVSQAARRLAAYMYRQKDAGTFDTTAFPEAGVITVPQGIPKDVLLLLEPFRRRWA